MIDQVFSNKRTSNNIEDTESIDEDDEIESTSNDNKMTISKKAKLRDSSKSVTSSLQIPSSVIVKFLNTINNTSIESPIDIPTSTTLKQLEMVVNSLLNNNEPIPYAFYLNEVEVTESLVETLTSLQLGAEKNSRISFEETLNIVYQPLSVFRVRPVTRCVETMPGHTDAVIHVSYSPDGKRLASGGGDMTVRFWNVSTSMPSHTCAGHKQHVLCTGWTANGQYFVSADKAGEIRVWNPSTGLQHGQPLKSHKKWITSLAFEPLHMDPTCIRFASSSKDHTIKVWNISTGFCETTISGHSDSVECIKWGGTGLIYSCSRDRTIKVWEVDGHGQSQHKLLRTLSGHAHRINTLALNCDYILRTGTYEFGKEQNKNHNADLIELKAIALERYNNMIGQDGERLVSGSDDFTLFMWKPQVDRVPVTRMVGHQQIINQIAFSPDARYVASASFDKKVKLWCGKTGRFLATLNGHVGSVYQISWSADSNYLASASKDSTVKVWSTKNTKKAQNTLSGHEDEVYTLDWSPNGTQLASGSKDRTIKIWHH
eukprot:gene8324-11265_t